MNKMQWLSLLILILILCALLTPVASAHRVHVESQIHEIQIKSWYGGGDSMKNADVKVYTIQDGEEELYIEGTTSDNGTFRFSPEIGVSEYRVVVDSNGHRGYENINLSGKSLPAKGDETPVYTRIISGFGYLAGLAGAGMMFMSLKRNKKGEEKNN